MEFVLFLLVVAAGFFFIRYRKTNGNLRETFFLDRLGIGEQPNTKSTKGKGR